MSRKSIKTKEPAVAATDGGLTLGRRLAAEREAQGLSVEDVAKVLRMRPALIREIENDDLRSFDHACYARLSLLGYARFLRLPDAEILPWLPDAGTISSGDFQYLEHYADPEPAARREDFARSRKPPPNPVAAFMKFLGALIVLVLGGYAYLLWSNIGRLGPREPAAAPEARAGAAPAEAPNPATEEIVLESALAPSPFLDADELALDLVGPGPGTDLPPGFAEPGEGGSADEPQPAAPPAGETPTATPEVRAALPVDGAPPAP